jgi:prepilin-type N-terminal cleavage/methylation domain-containing protein
MRSSRGFTLTELLIVVAIILLLVAVSIPSFLSASRAGRLSSAVRSVQAMLMGARNLAISYNAIYSVEFGFINLQQQRSGFDLRINDNDDWLNDVVDVVHGWKRDQRGYFVTVQREQPDDPNTQGDVIVREPIILPTGIVLAFNAHVTLAHPNNPIWSAIGPNPGNPTPGSNGKDDWDNTSVPRNNDDCPDIAFLGDGSCADAEGQSTVVLYDATEETDADGTVAAAVIIVVKYTGEVVIQTVRANRADLQ